MRRPTIALALGLAAWGLSGAGAGATTSDTEPYVNPVPGAAVVCESPTDGPSGTVVVPGVGGVCFFLPASAPSQVSLQIDDAAGQAVLAKWSAFEISSSSPSVSTPLASGVFCGSTTLSVPPTANQIQVSLGGTFVAVGSTNIVGTGTQGACPNPTSGTVTATYF